MIHGLIPVAKDQGITSHEVVEKIRRIFCIQKVGHFGTLDPAAKGVLLVGLGHVTRFFNFFMESRKHYRGIIRFGYATTTYDAEGEPLAEAKEFNLKNCNIPELLAPFKGEILQIPPSYSAKKFKGKPLYSYARKKIDVFPPAVAVTIYELHSRTLDETHLQIDVVSTSGTYIRSLAHDIGQRAGVGAHLKELTRLGVGEYTLDKAFSLADIERQVLEQHPEAVVIPIESLLPDFSKIIVSPGGRRAVTNGMALGSADILRIFPGTHPDYFRIFDDEGKLLAIAAKEPRTQTFRPTMVFPDLS